MVKGLLIVSFIMLVGSASYCQWTQKYFVDEFGDKTGKKYILYRDTRGTFSNSATSNSELIIDVLFSYSDIASLPEIRFDLYEYGRGSAVGNAISDATYTLTIKLSDNTSESYDLYAGEHSLYIGLFSIDEISFLTHLQKESKPIKCLIRGDRSEKYNFKINPVGFSNALSKIEPKAKKKVESLRVKENKVTSCDGTPTVYYEGKTYSTVQVGDQCWLKENLDVGKMIQVNQNPSNEGVIEKYCYDDDPNNCTTYGGLYQWNEAMQYVINEGAQGIVLVQREMEFRVS